MEYVIWDKDKPVATSDEKEAKRLRGRAKIIDHVLKEMGYSQGYNKYSEYVNEMVTKDFENI